MVYCNSTNHTGRPLLDTGTVSLENTKSLNGSLLEILWVYSLQGRLVVESVSLVPEENEELVKRMLAIICII